MVLAQPVVYDLGDLSSWVAAGLTLTAVVVALVVAAQDRREARREAAARWELEQLARLAVLSAHGGIPPDAPAELKAQESERAAERLVLGWLLGGPERFPVGLHRDADQTPDLAALRRLRDDPSQALFVRRQAEAVHLAVNAADTYRRERSSRLRPRQ